MVKVEIPDYVPAFIILLHIVHGKTWKVPRELDLKMLAYVARLIDQYFLHEAVELFTKLWMDALLSSGKIPRSLTDDLSSWASIC